MDLEKLKKEYDKRVPAHTRALHDVVSRIQEALDHEQIRVHSLKTRIKEFDSFQNKLSVKGYTKPFEQCTDIAGCRVVCLFKDHVEKIVAIIEEICSVVEKTQKQQAVNEFSYTSKHLLIHHDNCIIEVQVRTILQEAWSEIEHYVNYKHIGVDNTVLRKVNALSAVFELADDQFQAIHKEFMETQSSTALAKKERIDAVLLYHYCKTTFSWAWKHPEHFPNLDKLDEYEQLKQTLERKQITTVQQLDKRYAKYKQAIEQEDKERTAEILDNPAQWPKLYARVKATGHFYSPILLLLKSANR